MVLRVHRTAVGASILSLILTIQVSYLSPLQCCVHDAKLSELEESAAGRHHFGFDCTSWSPTSSPASPSLWDGHETLSRICLMQYEPGVRAAQIKMDGSGLDLPGMMEMKGPMLFSSEGSLSSSAPADLWGHSIYSSFAYMSNMLHLRVRRSTLTRYIPGTLPLIQTVTHPSAFRVRFNKCVQVMPNTDPPQLTFFLLIHNMGPVSGTNLSQVAVRDSLSGIVPLKTEGRVVERGYQTFAIDSLSAGSKIVVNYTALIESHKSEILDLPAFLTFSNASQNDVSMFGPLTANLTLRVNSTDRIHPNHSVHLAGFVAGFFVTLVLLSLGFLVLNLIDLRTKLHLLQQRRKRGDSDSEYADCNMSETIKDEAMFEDKMVDIMVLEDPQNMYQALENLEMSTLLRATNNMEGTRIQIYKDVISSLLGDLRSRGQTSVQAQQRLLSVLHGQLLGMEGRLKEVRGTRMAALAGQCNLETREEMEAEHCRETAEKAQAELLCQQADQQELLQCRALLKKLHKLSQSQLQRILLVRHEEASAKVQRQIIEWRRMELHKIFSEELEEATRMGELEKDTAKSLQHDYFTCQDQLEEVLDVVLANQRYVLAERHAQRKFLLHSLHSLNSLISDTFSSSSSNLDNWFTHIRRGSTLPAEQVDQLKEKAQKELVMVRQRLNETLNQEKRAMRCGLIKKRRELISEMLRVHKQREKDLSCLSRGLEGRMEVAQNLDCWQNLLTDHNLELAELINNLDEEATADIRKVMTHVIQGAIAEVKSILPSTAQALLTSLPSGTLMSLLQVEPEQGAAGQAQGQGASGLLQGQERLHQEGKTALRTLSCTREALQEAMERELQEQKEKREKCRVFFRYLCSFHLALSEDDRLRMKLEFQKYLSVMDRCLVLPHAVSRTKLLTHLAAWRKDREKQMINVQSKGKSSKARQNTDRSKLLLFQKRLEDKIQLFEKEKEKEMESSIMDKVLEEMQREREDELHSQADNLAILMATIHYQKAERRAKVLEMSRSMLTLQSLLIQQLRERKSLDGQDMAQSIQRHCLGLEEAEQQLQKDKTELCGLDICQGRAELNKTHREDSAESEDDKGVFRLQQDCRMTSILQDALFKCDQVVALLAESSQERITHNQAMEDLKEQMELKRLYCNCDQDVEFASQLVKQSQVSAEFLLETLRLLLPTMPESELLSVTDALCPKQHPGSVLTEHGHMGCAGGSDRRLSDKLRKDVVHKNMQTMQSCTEERERLQEKRQSLMEKLFSKSWPMLPRDAEPEKEKEDGCPRALRPVYRSNLNENPVKQQQSEPAREKAGNSVNETLHGSAEEYVTSASASSSAGERLFVFRDPPESHDCMDVPKRKRKRNFLNLKKGSVAPTNID